MRLPNFLIIGARKAGTTALNRYLGEHPEVFMSVVKEPKFFAYDGGRPQCNYPDGKPYPVLEVNNVETARDVVAKKIHVASFTNIEAYKALFADVKDEIAIGEASPLYLYQPEVPECIHHYVPDMKLIVSLRHPVDRAYSDFLNARRNEDEPIEDFVKAMAADDERYQLNYDPNWLYKRFGFYAAQLERYFAVFDRNQIKVILQEDLNQNTAEVLQDIFAFLGVDDTFQGDWGIKHNIGGVPKNRTIFNLLRKDNKVKDFVKSLTPVPVQTYIWQQLLDKPSLDASIRQALTEEYRSDILHLQDLLNRDLSAWLN